MATDEILTQSENELTFEQLMQDNAFVERHIGPSPRDVQSMLTAIGETSLDGLIHSTIPKGLLSEQPLDVPEAESEVSTLNRLQDYAEQNSVAKSMIGCGYYGTHVPQVIARNVLENPGWYTAYTPYQAEIAQGRLETLLTFQQMVMDLTGMEMANASLLDEATAAAEAMTLCSRVNKKSKSDVFFVANHVHPQTIEVLKTRGRYQAIQVVVGDLAEAEATDCFGMLVQYPGTTGNIEDLQPLIESAHRRDSLVVVATDLLALTLLKPPGEMGADVVVGSAQRFGVPMGFGGPHAAFFATRDEYRRSAPGRIIGVSRDSQGNMALRMAMQTREQHIRRDKATSNICTAQALLANMAALYAVYHGPEGLKIIATRTHLMAQLLRSGLIDEGFEIVHDDFFDTLLIELHSHERQREILECGYAVNVNLRPVGDTQIGVSFDETTTMDDAFLVLDVFTLQACHGETRDREISFADLSQEIAGIPDPLSRESEFLTHDVFHRYRSETEMLRYLKRLENKDFSLTHGMIPLGSCTMKLNATTEMVPVSWPQFAQLHPFAPPSQTEGYRTMIEELSRWLVSLTGYDAMSMQPNSGAQGEYAGLLAIVRYHNSLGQNQRKICLIPSSAHGTNPASARMMGLKVVVVKTDDDGNIDLDDLRSKAERHADQLSSLMITYPSTHGVFEEHVREACEIVHRHGGQVYLDGANMNAMVGLMTPGDLGADVSHLNLHKTFCIPHGGGGPGMGPIGVKSHLAPFLPGHCFDANAAPIEQADSVSAAPFGSALILPISWAYVNMMGAAGLKRASQVAILNANYIAGRLQDHYDVLYRGQNGRVAHECILDIRPIKQTSGVTEVDIAKRLMDFGFHAPTMSWPVPGTIMVEPTESESKEELDRFCEALLMIRDEIREIESGKVNVEDSALRHAPHTMSDLAADDWNRPYSRQQASLPTAATRKSKFWPSINRVDDVWGDRNFVCSCPPMSDYADGTDGADGEDAK